MFQKGNKLRKGLKPTNGFKKGCIPWDKGIKRPEISGKNHPMFGKHPPLKTRRKMSERHKGKVPWNKGQKGLQQAWNKGFLKEKSTNWKGGIPDSFYSARRRVRKLNAEGLHTYGEWELLKKQYGYTCPCCGRKEPEEIKLTEDHIIPLSKGGSDYIENIQPLCLSCNCKKQTKTIKY